MTGKLAAFEKDFEADEAATTASQMHSMDVRRSRGSLLTEYIENDPARSPEPGPLLVSLLGEGEGGKRRRKRNKPKALARQGWDSSPLVSLPGDAPKAEEARQKAEERAEARKIAAAVPRGREAGASEEGEARLACSAMR